MIFYLGNKVEGLIKDRDRVAKNNTKYWTYGYDKSLDTVIISKDGTLGDIYEMQGIRVGLPAQPPDEDIINNGKAVKHQKFVREELPYELTDQYIALEIGDEKDEDKIRGILSGIFNRHHEYIDRQFQIREEGMWIFLKGFPIYVPGTYAYGVQWVREEDEYPFLRIIQNELMIFWEACKADNRSFGMQYVKNRRMGASLMAIFELLESGSINENKLLGIVSKKGKDSENIFRRLVNSFKRLPAFFRPITDGTNTPKKKLVFDEPTKRRKKGESMAAGNGLQTQTEWFNTDMNAMDGDAVFRSLLDESAKYPPEVPFSKYWRIVKTSHTKGIRITGKSMVVSTVNEKKKGGREYEIVWDDSNLKTRDANGRTKSGLYPIFIPAYLCLEGMFDEYGFTIIEDPAKPVKTDEGLYTEIGTKTWLKNEEDKLRGDSEALNEFKRQYPETVQDAFRDASDECEFDIVRILEQLDHNKNELNDIFIDGKTWTGNDDVLRGNLSWKEGIRFGSVVWNEDKEKGKFFVKKGCLPPEQYRSTYIEVRRNGKMAFAPLAGHIGCIGVDPYNRNKTADGRGSKGTISGSTGTHECDELPNETFIFEYFERPKKVALFYEDALMAAIFWSMPFLAELSQEAFLTFVKDNGFRHFSMNNPFKLWHELSPTEQDLGGAPPQDSKIGDAQFYATEAYVLDHMGVARDSNHRPTGQMGDMPFTRTIEQIKEVDTNKRTQYDLYISASLSRCGVKRRALKKKPEEAVFELPFQTYDNSGSVSKPIYT